MPLEEIVLFQSSQVSEWMEKEKKRIKERSAKLSGQQDKPINQKRRFISVRMMCIWIKFKE